MEMRDDRSCISPSIAPILALASIADSKHPCTIGMMLSASCNVK
jgi:hypothetical protein